MARASGPGCCRLVPTQRLQLRGVRRARLVDVETAGRVLHRRRLDVAGARRARADRAPDGLPLRLTEVRDILSLLMLGGPVICVVAATVGVARCTRSASSPVPTSRRTGWPGGRATPSACWCSCRWCCWRQAAAITSCGAAGPSGGCRSRHCCCCCCRWASRSTHGRRPPKTTTSAARRNSAR